MSKLLSRQIRVLHGEKKKGAIQRIRATNESSETRFGRGRSAISHKRSRKVNSSVKSQPPAPSRIPSPSQLVFRIPITRTKLVKYLSRPAKGSTITSKLSFLIRTFLFELFKTWKVFQLGVRRVWNTAAAVNPRTKKSSIRSWANRKTRMLSSIEVITTPTSDTPGTALLFSFHDKRYLIGNIHEGLTRAVVQRGIRLAKVSDIFITGRTEWKSTGGLLGTIMSLADTLSSAAAAVAAAAEEKAVILQKRGKDAKTNVERGGQEKMDSQAVREKLTEEENGEGGVAPADPKLTVHGGPNITHSIAAARKFIFRKRMSVCVDEFLETAKRRGADCDWEPDWVDERLQVWTMAIAPTENGDAGSLPGSQSPLKRRYKEFADDQSPASAKTDRKSSPISAAPSADDQRIRASVISDMFGSPWHMACFHEVPLAEVKMPAQIFTRDQDTQEIRPYRGPVPDGANAVPPINVLVRRPWPGALVMNLPATKPSKVAMSYIMRNHRQRGRFQPQKAIALKVRPGPLFAKLANGESVQSMDGRTITPDMVLLEPREGSGVAVVDLPSHEYVHNLVERPEWRVPKVMSGVEMIIWILGPGVGQNEQLQRFMSQYGHLKHMISSQDHCPNYISFDSSASGALRLNQIDPIRYPIPVHDNVSLPQLGQPQISQPKSERHPNIDIIQAKRGMKLMLTPSVSINIDQYAPPLDTVKVLLTTPPAVLKLGQAAREIIESESHQKEVQRQDLPSPDAEIICLGTGSALPSKYRNVSSTLLRVPGSGSYLLDCGENTLGQLKRLYRPEQLSELLRDLKLIWISHLHADHHLGLTSVIKAWYEEIHGQKIGTPQEPRAPPGKQGTDQASWIPVKDSLVLVSSHSMTEFLREYSQVEDFGFDHVTKLYTRGAYDGAPSSVLYYDNCRVGFDFGPEERWAIF